MAFGAFALILALTFILPRIFPIGFDLTWLIIISMIAAAWYLGRGPGLLIAILLEATLVYFTKFSAIITFNRLILFGSVVLFASSRRNAEKELRRQHELLQVTLESIGDAVIATDADGKINFINPVAETLTGWTIGEAAGKPLDEIFHIVNEETREPVESPFTVIKRDGVVVGLANHTTLITKDEREIPIEDSGAPIKDESGNVIGAILVFHDISERRSAEREREKLHKNEQFARAEAESANRLKDEFLATVSHELRTPLNAILGWASMLNRGTLTPENIQNALNIIERNAKAQADIISDILDVSRIITGKLQIESNAVELAPIIRSAVETLQPAADAKGIDLTVSLDETEGFVIGDADRLLQIIWNLISNAIKFTPNNGQIEIKLEKIDSHVEIQVSDNGIGISPEFIPFVFERFRQADASTTRSDSGLGLGLAIVRHLAELHGGTVRAESKGETKGAIFTLSLPMASAAEAQTRNLPPDKAENIRENKPDLSGLRVLVVDDDTDTLEVLELMLNQYGAEVRTSVSSADALEALHEWKPSVIVSDIGMPNEDGYALIGKIRDLAPEQGGNVPAAALTAYVSEGDKLQALAAGFQTHISKPVEPIELAEAVAELVKNAKKN